MSLVSAGPIHRIKISIIEDSEIHSEWLKAELENNAEFEIVSIDNSARSGIQSVKQNHPDVVMLDFQLEDMTGLEVARRIDAYDETIKIFMITAHTEISIIERLIEDKSIKGLAIKGSQYFGDNLVPAIKNISTGGVYLDPSLLNKLRESGKANGISNLTRREFEVFIQSNAGKPDIKIAQDLNVELLYIKNVKSKITKKIKDTNMHSLLCELTQHANIFQLTTEVD